MNKIELFDWQRNALKKWVANKGKGIIESPTGSGKTYLALKLMEKEKLSPFLVIVPNIELLTQWERQIRKYYPDASIKSIGGGKKYDGFINTLDSSNRKIVIAVINSIRRKHLKTKTLIID